MRYKSVEYTRDIRVIEAAIIDDEEETCPDCDKTLWLCRCQNGD